MSRTDVHRPYNIQTQDPDNRHRSYWLQRYGRETPVRVLTYSTCGCELCTGQVYRKQKRRRERTLWRAQRQAALKTTDRSDLDIPPPPRELWW